MKKSLIATASVAAFAVAAVPMVAFAADDVQTQTDTLNVTISPTCTMSSVTHAATATGANWENNKLTATVTAGAEVELGTTTFNIKCNNQAGWNVSAVATALEGQTTAAQTIPVGTTGANTAAWKYVSTSTDEGVTTNKTNTNPVASASATTGNDGKNFTMTYTVSTDNLLSAQAYEGSITYTLAQGAYNAG